MSTEEETYIWSHEPFLSGIPVERIYHKLIKNEDNEIDEFAVFRLSNDKFLFIRFCGHLGDLEEGVTDLEELDSKEEAENIYNSLINEGLDKK